MRLPVEDILPELTAALRVGSNAVLVAPPGAGKTTAVAPVLLNEPWCTGSILLLSPRRIAARSAAERMAELAGEKVGQTIGYATRMDSRQSAATRILVMTEGIFIRRIQADPELAGVSAILFDEVHERSLDTDFGLALALDAQGGLRPDLRLLAMSATLDGSRFSALMGDAPMIESEGRSYPLTLRHVGRKAEARIEDEMAATIRRALAEEEGDLLAFLPGVGEINRTAERLAGIAADVHFLHGTLDPAAQRVALRKGPTRRVVLATSIAETSLTLDGVRIVVDSGLARRPRYDRAAGVARLVTERVSQAAVTQRAGRAARQMPGVAYRLWEEAGTAGLMPFDPPEILEADLSDLMLNTAQWGVRDPLTLAWLDPPPAAALAEAKRRLSDFGALNADGAITAHGKAMAALPLSPRFAHMLLAAHAQGMGQVAAEAAMLISERGLGGTGVDLDERHRRWRGDRSPRAEAARRSVAGWVRSLGGDRGGQHDGLAQAIALAFPDRVAKRRDASGERWLSAGGRGLRLDPTDPLARADWLAVADIQGSAAEARILSAAALTLAEVEALFAGRIETGASVTFDPATGSVRTESGRRLGAIILSKGQDAKADPEAIVDALLGGVRDHGLALLPWPTVTDSLRTRAAFAGVDGLSDKALLASLDDWLRPLLSDKRKLSELSDSLHQAMTDLLGWDQQKELNRLAPAHFISPAGQTHDIDYAATAGPTVTLRVQALFGLADHPCVGRDRIPLVLSLTSPAGRPIQTTRDLPGFWRGSWADVAKEMRGRYPRHNWPDDPTQAIASLKTKKALDRKP